MSRVEEFLALIDDPDAPALAQPHPDDGPLRDLLLHLALADGIVEADEIALLMRVRPDLTHDDVVAWAMASFERPFDPSPLAKIATSEARGRDILRFAARMVCLDGDIAADEVRSLQELAEVMSLPADAPRAAIDEIVARGGDITRERVAESLRNMLWRELVPTRDDLGPDFTAVCPEDLTPVCVLTLDDRQVGALFFEGLVAHFDQGPTWIAFENMASYTRVPVHGAAFHLHTLDGHHLSISKPRMRDLGALCDFICGRTEVPPMDP